MTGRLCLLVAVTLLGACAGERVPVPLTPAADVDSAAVVRRALPEPAPQVATAKPVLPFLVPTPAPPVVVPAGSQYVCVSATDGERQQTAIEFSPKVAELCRKHPEMGPCQYERDICRRSGGRVYAAGGVEITHATEAEYDRRVMRVRFQAN